MSKYTIHLEEDCIYHIYNHANGNERSFVDKKDYTLFLKGLEKYILPYCFVYAYSLLPNHFHLIIRVKSKVVFKDTKSATKSKRNHEISDILSLQFSKWFNSYSKSFNLKHQRKGSLFTRPFKRKRIADIQYLRKLIHYIHYNPVEAKLCSKPENWTFSSYKAIISERKTQIKKKEVIELFDDRENFIYCHSVEPQMSGLG